MVTYSLKAPRAPNLVWSRQPPSVLILLQWLLPLQLVLLPLLFMLQTTTATRPPAAHAPAPVLLAAAPCYYCYCNCCSYGCHDYFYFSYWLRFRLCRFSSLAFGSVSRLPLKTCDFRTYQVADAGQPITYAAADAGAWQGSKC